MGQLKRGALMRKVLLASLALTALVAAPAMAADLRRPPPRPLPPPVPIFTWTGCYVGGHVGGLWVQKEWFDHNDSQSFNDQSEGAHDVHGFVVGVQGGCDYQFAGGFVIGVNVQWAWANADGEHRRLLDSDFVLHSEVTSVGSVTGRLGYGFDRFLLYVKGGVAWERDEFHIRHIDCSECVWSAEDTRTGFTVGIGAEFAFTNWVSIFVEANYYNFDDESIKFTRDSCGQIGCDPFDKRIEEEKFIVKAGLNLRFGGWGGAPVAARY
jgi:outer membrane immunogenic protein